MSSATRSTLLAGFTTSLWFWRSPAAVSTLSSTPQSTRSSSRVSDVWCHMWINSSHKLLPAPDIQHQLFLVLWLVGVRTQVADKRHSITLIRPPDLVVGGLRFYRDSSSFSIYLFSSATLRTRWTELNQNRSHARKWLRFKNVCSKSPVPLPLKIGSNETTFSTTSQLDGDFNGLYLANETRYT